MRFSAACLARGWFLRAARVEDGEKEQRSKEAAKSNALTSADNFRPEGNRASR